MTPYKYSKYEYKYNYTKCDMMQASYMIIPLVKYGENKIVQFSVISR